MTTPRTPLPLSAPPRPDEEIASMEADAMLEPSPSAMLAGVHVTPRRRQDCACDGKHEHRFGYMEDCDVPDCTCMGFRPEVNDD